MSETALDLKRPAAAEADKAKKDAEEPAAKKAKSDSPDDSKTDTKVDNGKASEKENGDAKEHKDKTPQKQDKEVRDRHMMVKCNSPGLICEYQ